MDDIMFPLPEPSQKIIDAMVKQQKLAYETVVNNVKKWEELLTNNSISAGSFTLHEDGLDMLEQNELLKVHMCLDLLGDSHDRLMLSASFHKGGTAWIDSGFFSDETRKKNPDVYERYANFLGFEGTWEEVARKIFELNDFVVAENTPPPIPDDLQK
ncbi:MAG: hypothetical protein HGA67_01595 [Candidatus Yonathbacteria bacterium]|nr:hypothetical protein [Candidatus Yonathbacteria bacterium]